MSESLRKETAQMVKDLNRLKGFMEFLLGPGEASKIAGFHFDAAIKRAEGLHASAKSLFPQEGDD